MVPRQKLLFISVSSFIALRNTPSKWSFDIFPPHFTMKSKLATSSGQEQMEWRWPLPSFTKQPSTYPWSGLSSYPHSYISFPKTVMTQQVSNKPRNPIPHLTTIYNAVGIAFLSLYFSPPHPHQFQFLKHHNYIYYYKLLASTIRPVLCVLSLLKTIQQGGAVKPILLRVRDLLQGDLAALELKRKCAGPQSTFNYSCCLSPSSLAKPRMKQLPFGGNDFFKVS